MNNEPVAWMYQDDESRSVAFYRDTLPCGAIPLYTHPAQELNDGGEPVKNATYWKRQHDRLLMKLNISAIHIAELEKQLAKYGKSGQSIPCQYTEGNV